MPYVIYAFLLFFICFAHVGKSYSDDKKIYKTVHSDGTVSYSDQASEGAIEVNLNTNTTTIEALQTPSATPPPPSPAMKKRMEYHVSVLSPSKDATIRNNLGEINIVAQLEPATGGFFELIINDSKYQSATGIFALSNMDRGSYQYLINFVDNSGKVIASSESRTLHLHKASVLIN